jgi:hypothetical protein
MILTDRFVYIHLPKTGGTFVTAVLERLMKPPRPRNWPERVLRRLRRRRWRDTNKHGTCAEIPASHRGLPVFACVRNPFDRCVSQYEFGWWKDRPPPWVDSAAIRRRYPAFPGVPFADFVEISATAFPRLRGSPLSGEDALGWQTDQFVRTFFRDPEAAWRRIDDAYIDGRRWEEDLHPVRFLRTENLNADLHAFLLGVGFAPAEVDWVLREGKIRPAGAKGERRPSWEEYYTPDLRARVRRRERLLFAMFPEYDAAR